MNEIEGIANLTRRTAGSDARAQNVAAGTALSDLVRSTLGPNGRDKMLVGNGTVVVTNDGASIVDRVPIDSPAARLVAGVARAQSGELGDGSTAAIVLAGALLAEAESLVEDGVHPTSVIAGYHEAATRVGQVLDEVATTPVDIEAARRSLVETAITGRWDEARTTFLADLTARAYRAARHGDAVRLENVTVHGVPGAATTASELIDGLVVDTDASSTSLADIPAPAPRRIRDARIAVVDDELTIDSPKSVTRYTVADATELERTRTFERDEYRRFVETLTTHDVDVLFCQKSVDDRLRTELGRAGVLVFERTRQDEVHKLGRATGARPVMRLDELDAAAVGNADDVERVTLGGGAFVIVRSASSSQVSLLLRGGPSHVVDETERIVVDALSLLQTFDARPRLVPGGGACEVTLARDLRRWGRGVGGRESLAVDAFADALETIPRTLARNAGHDPIDALLELRHRHADGETHTGLDVEADQFGDMVARDVVEPVRLKDRVVANATDAATLVLRIDGIVETAGNGSGGGGHHHDHEHDHSHAGGGFRSDPHGYPWAISH